MANSLVSTVSCLFASRKKSVCNLRLGLCLTLVFLPASLSLADSVVSGDVEPTDPSLWSNPSSQPIGDIIVGKNSEGSLTVNNGSVLFSFTGSLGYLSGSSGEVTIDGSGSTWENRGQLYVGQFGNGTLNITNGGTVIYKGTDPPLPILVFPSCYLGANSGSTGEVNVDGEGSNLTGFERLYIGTSGRGTLNIANGGQVSVNGNTYVAAPGDAQGLIHFGTNGGTLSSRSLYFTPSQVTGTGTINTQGLISDMDLVFDASHGLTQTLTMNGSGQNVTINFDLSGNSGRAGDLGAGYMGKGSMMIHDGLAVQSQAGYIGYHAGSTGTVTVNGRGSIWTNRTLDVGYDGQGTLNITNGGTVKNLDPVTFIGHNFGSTGEVTVDGAGSTLSNTAGSDYEGALYVGLSGKGTLNITNGGAVTVPGITYVAANKGSTGLVQFGTNGGTLSTRSLYFSPSQITGTGTINTRGLVSDMDLVFDADHGLAQTLLLDESGQNTTINLDLSGNSGQAGDLGAGYQEQGSMKVRDGLTVTSRNGYIGYKPHSMGMVSVEGQGSTWTICDGLTAGYSGTGTLSITKGGAVESSSGVVSWNDDTNSGATGKVSIDGTGSVWRNRDNFFIGYSCGGNGSLTITNGGELSDIDSYIANSINVDSSTAKGQATVDGTDSLWSNSRDLYVGYNGHGTLTISNNGLVTVGRKLYIDCHNYGDSFIDMDRGGMLALKGEADNSLADYLNLIDGTDAIRYWDDTTSSWQNITLATAGVDYTLEYLTSGDLSGYTVLSVTAVPEPMTLSLLSFLGLVGLLRRK
jgi:T5SS/PEP-CTERM-associated repeat protein